MSARGGGRPRVLIGLRSDIFVRNFVETGAFDALAQAAEVFWCRTDAVKRPLPARPGFTDAGVVATSARHEALRYHLRWVAVFAGHRRGQTMAVKRRYMTFSRWDRAWYTLLSLPGVWPAVDVLAESWLGLNASLGRVLEAVRPDVIVFPSQGNDSFAIDVLRQARRRKIRTVMLNYNWDNMSSKGPMRLRPDRLCVWGRDMAATVVRIHRLPAGHVKPIGAAHFEQHLRTPSDAVWQRRQAGDVPRLLFAGGSRGHPEARYLRALDEAISDGRLPPLQVIFRPHPWRSVREQERDFDSYGYRHVAMDRQLAEHFRGGLNAPGREPDRTFAPPIDYNVELLSQVSGIVSPMSTLALEAVLLGVPVLILNCFDEEWLRHALPRFEHLRRLRDGLPGVRVCEGEAGLIEEVAALLARSRDRALIEAMRAAARPLVHDAPGSNYAQRLAAVVHELCGSGGAMPAAPAPSAPVALVPAEAA